MSRVSTDRGYDGLQWICTQGPIAVAPTPAVAAPWQQAAASPCTHGNLNVFEIHLRAAARVQHALLLLRAEPEPVTASSVPAQGPVTPAPETGLCALSTLLRGFLGTYVYQWQKNNSRLTSCCQQHPHSCVKRAAAPMPNPHPLYEDRLPCFRAYATNAYASVSMAAWYRERANCQLIKRAITR